MAPPKTALLVVDMQVFFESMATAALPNIIKLCDHFVKTSAPIVFTKHGHPQSEMVAHSTSQLVRRWGVKGSIGEGSAAGEIVSELQRFLPKANKTPTIGELLPGPESPEFPKLLPKNTYDGFINTPLSSLLENAKVERVIVCGVMTDCCCDTTARSSFNRGYETWLVSDACGSANKTQHEAGLEGLRVRVWRGDEDKRGDIDAR
ncbi:isochorismatase-like protein [Cladophialophora carrionii]|uniref:Isochorismatase-like protein n=1 Tax=Cladophialophora carrionii TaxID=86049 RepID=A0A1C1C8Q5_9EURO|nr:isochorismatase-like protein [Cladophialophora carrionii]